MVSPSVSAPLKVEKEVLDEYVREVASDPLREVDLGELAGLPAAPANKVAWNVRSFAFTRFKNILSRKKTLSRPGQNRISSVVYKKCPQIARYLFNIFQEARRNMTGTGDDMTVPLCWRTNDGIMIPKVACPKSSEIGDYRQIALLNVEGKLFWSLVADKLYNYLVVDNSYVSSEVQKMILNYKVHIWT